MLLVDYIATYTGDHIQQKILTASIEPTERGLSIITLYDILKCNAIQYEHNNHLTDVKIGYIREITK